ncbi:MAG: AAA family ATPase [Patescibacteria group bacterium]|nr:AAA family ATPase [Patescibacteria group bacterium]
MGEKHAKLVTRFACPTCRGIGVQGAQRCRTCGGRGTIGRQGDLMLYWGRPIDYRHLAQRHVIAIAQYTVVTILLGFAALGVGGLLWQLILLDQYGVPLWRFWEQQNIWMLTFWWSLVVDSYLVYHFSQEYAKIQHIPRRARRGVTGAAAPPTSWETALQVRRGQTVNLSDLYTAEAIAAVEKSWEFAASSRHHAVAPLHLLVALLQFPAMTEMFVRLGAPFTRLNRLVTGALPRYAVPTGNALTFDAEYFEALFSAYEEAWSRQQKKVDLSELLVACVTTSEVVRDVLYDVKIDTDAIHNVAAWFRVRREQRARYHHLRSRTSYRPRRTTMDRAMTAVATPALDSFSQDLTQLARAGYLEPCLGRDHEVTEIFRIFSAGGRQNIVLVGNPGIGKRTIVNGVAQLMVAEDVPKFMQDKRLVSLSVARLISGVTASVAEERLLHCLNEAARSRNIILFINDVSKMVGISPGGSASLDLAGALAQALTQTGLRAITTALPTDYSRYVENHLLGQVLEKMNIEEPEGNDAIQILEAKVGAIEANYHVYFTYEAIAQAVKLSGRYLHDRFLPEKAIEVLDESAVRTLNEKGRDSSVTGQDVALTVSEKTGIPLTEVTQQESAKLLNLEQEIHQRMVDQEEAVKLVSAAIRRARAELRDVRRPIVNLLFLGPTGVGKTELAKIVASVYFGRASELIRLDMSEYQEKSSVNRLLGAPAGFEGHGEGGYLTEAVRHHPFALLLLDEIEKAHPDILNLFLQVMDDGRLTDAVGRTVDFTNVILIATSNACTPTIQRLTAAGVSVAEVKAKLLSGELQQHFRPEFLNRFDSVVVFKPLGMPEVQKIARLMLQEVGKRLLEKGVSLQPTDAAIDELATAGYDPEFGARPLRRVIQERVDDAIATKILGGELERRDTIILDVGGRVTIKKPARRA